MTSKTFNAEFILSRHHVRPVEILPWVLAVLAFFVFPDYLQLGAQVLILILFALSLDLILGYAGIISLGHAALFGTGAYAAGILSAHGKWGEPLTGLVVAAVAAALVGLISGWVILRTRGLSLLMLTMATTILLQEFANQQEEITGGDDGLQDVSMDPLLGLFEFDLVGETAYLYSLAVLFVLFLVVRCIVYSSFGQSLRGIRENVVRMHAIGSPVDRRVLCVYTISAALAGVAGALLAQTTEFVALDVLSFERSGDVLIVIILGGTGRLYGAFIGAPIYLLLQDQLAQWSPEYWLFGIGLVLVLRVIFVPQGLLGLFDTVSRRLSGGRG
ncbi:MAG: branched-chain amino acid ABC transporter permease [Gemmatimonadetes bacterium]|nr:branched-chain amino acid ABC transporter permease [Gemmatimonadota bacterium]